MDEAVLHSSAQQLFLSCPGGSMPTAIICLYVEDNFATTLPSEE